MPGKILVTFLRHGRSRADDEGVFEGRYDAPLTDMGRAQVQARANGWKELGVHFDWIICSTLSRAYESAEIVGRILGVAVQPDPAWMEMDAGLLAGLSYAEGESLYPRPAFRNAYEHICQTGESEWDLHLRAARAVQDLVRRGPGCYLVVSHGGILNAALRAIFGAPLPLNGAGLWIKFGDTGYMRLEYNPGGHTWVLQELVPGEG